MNRSRRFELWTSGILAVVCLLLLNILVWQFRKEPTLRLVGVDSARSASITRHPPATSRENHELRRVEAAPSSTAAAKSRAQSVARSPRHPLESEPAKRVDTLPPPEAHLPAVVAPQPKMTTLEPLGYVEKADGRVEAIISLGEHVEVVHEGEIFEDKFRVAKISPSTVELVENSAPLAEPPLMAEVGQGVAHGPADKAGQTPLRRVPEAVSHTDAARQFDGPSAAGGLQPAGRQQLGYVERADGRVEAIVAEGEHVRLAPGTKSFADNFRAPAPSPANLQVAKALPPTINPPDSLGLETQPLETVSSTQEAGMPPPIAPGFETSTADQPQGIPGSNAELGSEQFGIIQPEPLAEYSGPRFEPRDVAPGFSPTGAALKGGATPPLPSGGKGTQSNVSTLGYVEKAGGEKEAIVAVLDQVYLVHEGELFAEKYRALQVNPSSVEIAEDSTEVSSPSAESRWNSELVESPNSWLRAPPLSAGSSGSTPPEEVREAQESAAGEAAALAKPPPEHPIEWWRETKRVKTPQAAPEGVRTARRPVETDGHSPPYALKTVGFVEKANGETEAVVADEGGVYLVRSGEEVLENPKIPNPVPAGAQTTKESFQNFGGGLPVEAQVATSFNSQELSSASWLVQSKERVPDSPSGISAEQKTAQTKSPLSGSEISPVTNRALTLPELLSVFPIATFNHDLPQTHQ